MTLPFFFSYTLRLACLSLASFFLIHLILSLLVRLAAPGFIRMAERLEPRLAVRFALALRFAPFVLATLLVGAICVPSYLRFEPQGVAEPIGWACLLAAGLGAFLYLTAIMRGLRAITRSARYIRDCGRMARPVQLADSGTPAFVFEDAAPGIVLAGIVHPRLLVSSTVLKVLSEEELAVALRHEQAHCESRDNFKRLLLLFAPGMLPFFHGFDLLESAWARFAEWAADDTAIADDATRSISLASVLVRLTRLSIPRKPAPLVTSLLADGCDLAQRVERLLNRASERGKSSRVTSFAATGAITSLLVALAVILVNNASLLSVHAMLERLIH